MPAVLNQILTLTNERFYLSVVAFLSSASFSQFIVSGADINALESLRVSCVKIDGVEQISGMDPSVDYGPIERKSTKRLTDRITGKKRTVSSITHVMNDMENNGWHHYNRRPLMQR